VALRFNPPPNWPAPPPGFVPPPRWQPDPAWPPPPPGWELWVSDDDTDPGNGTFQRRATGPGPRVAEPPAWARDFAAARGDLAAGRGDFAAEPGDFATGPGDFATGPGDFGAGPGAFATELGDFPAGLEDFPGEESDVPGGYAGFPGDPGGPGDFTGVAPTQAYQPGGPQGPRGARPGPGRPGPGRPVPGRPGAGRRGRRRRVLVAGSVLAVLVLAAVLYVVLRGSPKPAAPSATGSHPPVPTPSASGSNQLTNVFSLQAGQCFQNPPASQTVLGITYVAVVSCTTPHNAQVFVQFPATGTSYPGSSALRQQSDTGCHKQIAKNVQKSKITNSMTLRYLYPLPSSWADGHRLITCLIVDAKPDLKTSLLRTHSGH
jgi:hypothetical protein